MKVKLLKDVENFKAGEIVNVKKIISEDSTQGIDSNYFGEDIYTDWEIIIPDQGFLEWIFSPSVIVNQKDFEPL